MEHTTSNGRLRTSVGVGLGEAVFGRDGEGADEWVIYGLGSCVGLILVDAAAGAAAMAHIVLPKSPGHAPVRPAKYADTAVPYLLEGLAGLGAAVNRVVAHVVGGAKMLKLGAVADIGRRNTEAVRFLLEERGIPVVGECVGGNAGRTLRWDRRRRLAIVSQVGKDDLVFPTSGGAGARCGNAGTQV